jgi:hypothetical protein
MKRCPSYGAMKRSPSYGVTERSTSYGVLVVRARTVAGTAISSQATRAATQNRRLAGFHTIPD